MPRDKVTLGADSAPGLVRARLVAKDFAHGRPSALDLGLSSNTASVEALKLILSRAAKGRMRIWVWTSLLHSCLRMLSNPP